MRDLYVLEIESEKDNCFQWLSKHMKLCHPEEIFRNPTYIDRGSKIYPCIHLRTMLTILFFETSFILYRKGVLKEDEWKFQF
jgi:hypothetical protein